ncbi:hypothetical protein ABT160_02735 [Streptomyces sp. NPDC001941]|uniref:hypothetical protein n=1 Tax=Streptomyces sp. NPDC001941 TaxID=3154659 RepID=UPI003321D6BC
MPDLWMPGATRLDIGDHAPTDGGPAKAIAHITWDRNATAAKPADLVPYTNLVEYFGRNPDGKAAAPHLLWDPFTGAVTQFHPATSRSKSLADQAGGTRTNRAGSVVIQIETVFFPYCRVGGRVYAELTDTPCKGWPELLAWVRSWGVPDVWPMGRPIDFAPRRSESVWESRAGWYAHAHVPENDHQDPGSWPAFTTSPTPVPAEEDPVPEDLTESTDTDVRIPADTWTLTAMAADSALLQGKASYVLTSYATVAGAPGTRVKGRYQDYDVAKKRSSLDLPMDAGVIGADGRLDVHLDRNGQLPAGTQLRLELWADKPITVTYRVLRGRVWR